MPEDTAPCERVRVAVGVYEARQIAFHQPVRAAREGDRPFRIRPRRQARHTQVGRLFLNAGQSVSTRKPERASQGARKSK